jgi:hypothetical protein
MHTKFHKDRFTCSKTLGGDMRIDANSKMITLAYYSLKVRNAG